MIVYHYTRVMGGILTSKLKNSQISDTIFINIAIAVQAATYDRHLQNHYIYIVTIIGHPSLKGQQSFLLILLCIFTA